MTTTTQQLILGRITTAIGAHSEVVLTHDPQYANTGTLRTLDATTLAQIAAVSYDFQQEYCHFGPMSNRVAGLWYGKPTTSQTWVKGSIPELVDTVVGHLLRNRSVNGA